MDGSDFLIREPRGGIVGDACLDVLRDVTRNVVVNECRGFHICGDDFAVSGKSGFDQGLEAVANAENESVAVFEEIGNRIGDAGIAQDGCNEFRRTIGFVTGGEAAWDEKDLCGFDLSCKRVDGFLDVFGGEVAENLDVGLCTCALESAGRVVFRVGAREGGDQNSWFD